MDQKYGLQINPVDERDYSHDEFFGTLGASALPTNNFTIYDQLKYTVKWGDTLNSICASFNCKLNTLLALNPSITNPNKIFTGQVITIPARANTILNQLDLDFCTAFTTVELQNAIWGIPFDPMYQMAKIKQISGDLSGFGASLRDAATSVIKYGSLQASSAPYAYPGGPTITRDFLANYQNYPIGFDILASKEKDLSYFAVTGPNDAFDNIRSILWQHINERRGVTLGLFWHEAWTEAPGGIIPDAMPNDAFGGGHDLSIIGQTTINGEIYLIAQNHWGNTAGNNGYYYFPRSIINLSFNEGYGAYSFSNKDASGLKNAGGFMTVLATFFNKLLGNI